MIIVFIDFNTDGAKYLLINFAFYVEFIWNMLANVYYSWK